MPSKDKIRVFLSHKEEHRDIAVGIRDILNFLSERLEVFMFEDQPAGEAYRDQIKTALAESDLLLLLYLNPSLEWDWCLYEVGLFTSLGKEPRPIVCIHIAQKGPPRQLEDLQTVQADADEIRVKFLEPLLNGNGDGPIKGLNAGIPRVRLEAAAKVMSAQITQLPPRRRYYQDIVSVSIPNPDWIRDGKIPESARVTVEGDSFQALSLDRNELSWGELVALAEENRGKGTYWVHEIEQVISEASQNREPRTMSSTFRGIRKGKIYRPTVYRVDSANGLPIKYWIVFNTTLQPERVRGKGRVGELFSFLHAGSRVRWEIIEPFLKTIRDQGKRAPDDSLFRRIRESVDVIEVEIDRHRCIDDTAIDEAFEGETRKIVYQFREERRAIHEKLMNALDEKDLDRVRDCLEKKRSLNIRVMALASRSYYEHLESEYRDLEDEALVLEGALCARD